MLRMRRPDSFSTSPLSFSRIMPRAVSRSSSAMRSSSLIWRSIVFLSSSSFWTRRSRCCTSSASLRSAFLIFASRESFLRSRFSSFCVRRFSCCVISRRRSLISLSTSSLILRASSLIFRASLFAVTRASRRIWEASRSASSLTFAASRDALVLPFLERMVTMISTMAMPIMQPPIISR